MKKFQLVCWLLLAILPLGVQAQQPKKKKKPASAIRDSLAREIPPIQYGVASFYDNKFEGRRTANGELFSQKKLTAASNTLPLNSWVKVTNLSNKRSVIVRITDRMHHRNKRLIDLSRSAASKLGYIGRGLTRVKVEYLGKEKPGEELSTN